MLASGGMSMYATGWLESRSYLQFCRERSCGSGISNPAEAAEIPSCRLMASEALPFPILHKCTADDVQIDEITVHKMVYCNYDIHKQGGSRMATSNVTIRMDEDLKRQADEVLGEMGMSFTTAVNVFARQVVRERRIPFEISARADAGAVDPDALRAAIDFSERYPDDFRRMAQ